jgi:hypothetical protein
MEWEKIFSRCSSNVGLISRISKAYKLNTEQIIQLTNTEMILATQEAETRRMAV